MCDRETRASAWAILSPSCPIVGGPPVFERLPMRTMVMTRCETKRRFKINGVKQTRWVEVAVADIANGDEVEIRCAHCHGAVKLLKANVDRGEEDHVKHRSRVDTENCQAGQGPQGGQGLSSKPVE
jgi:hypothetical protein